MKIFLAAGHGGNDPGAVANNTNERDEVQKIVDAAVTTLTAVLEGKAEIVKVPNQLNVNNTAEWINEEDKGNTNSVAVEVHLNSNRFIPGTGTETYYGNKNVAEIIQKNLVVKLGLKNRGVKNGENLKFNRDTVPASAVIELGFINNAHDLKVIREKGVEALTQAIYALAHLELPTEPNPIVPEKELLKEVKSALEQEIQNLKNIQNKIN